MLPWFALSPRARRLGLRGGLTRGDDLKPEVRRRVNFFLVVAGVCDSTAGLMGKANAGLGW